MIHTTPFKVTFVVAKTIALCVLLTTSVSAQTSSEKSLVDAARALGLTPTVVSVPLKVTTNHQQLQQNSQNGQVRKSDPYAAQRQHTLRQNAQRRKAHHQRLANIQRQKHQQARNKKNTTTK